jgi:hypothetical protein
MKKLSEEAKVFMALKPRYVGFVREVFFYEHPLFREGATLMAITASGNLEKTSHNDVPSTDEIDSDLLTA